MQTQQIAALAIIAAGTGALFAPSAHAQDTGLIPVRVKAGVFLPNDKDVAGSTNLLGEVDVAIPNFGQGKYIASAGYTSGSRNGNKARVIPVTIGRYFQPPNPAGAVTGKVYFGAGVGPYFVNVRNNGDSENKVALGGYGVAGYQLPSKYFLEAKYHIATKVNGVQPGGLAIAIGRSF